MEPVFVFEIEDAEAAGWSAEVAVQAAKQGEAARRLRDGGLHKKQIHNHGLPVRVVSVAEVPEVEAAETGFARRRLEGGGWTAWEVVPSDDSLNWRVNGRVRTQTRGSGHR